MNTLKKFSLICSLLALILTGCQKEGVSAVKGLNSEPIDSPMSQSEQEKNRLLQLNDAGIDDAIKIGESLTKSNSSEFREKYLLPVLHNDIGGDFSKELEPEVLFTTNYYKIVEKSFGKSQRLDNLSFEDAKRENNGFTLDFILVTFGDSLTMSKGFYCVLKQGETIIKPVGDKLVGADNFTSKSEDWPKFPSYTQKLIVMFADTDKVDFSKPAEFIFLYDGKEKSVTYTLDFGSYR